MSDITMFEHLTLKVPYELLNKKFRMAQKNIDREVSHTQHLCAEVAEKLKEQEGGHGPKYGTVIPLVDKVLASLEKFKHRLSAVVEQETEAAGLLKQRLDHIKTGILVGAQDSPQGEHWRKTRIDRMLVEYFLRAGYLESAEKLAEQLEITYLTNIPLFKAALEVETALKNKDIGPCLSWCVDNKSKLRRTKSTFELSVRQQEYVELIRDGNYQEATKYAQKYFSGLDKESWRQLLPYMALLAYPPSTNVYKYQSLYDEDRWALLMQEFHAENLKLFQLNVQSIFSSCLQAGLTALKTPHCYQTDVITPSTFSKRIPVVVSATGVTGIPPTGHGALVTPSLLGMVEDMDTTPANMDTTPTSTLDDDIDDMTPSTTGSSAGGLASAEFSSSGGEGPSHSARGPSQSHVGQSRRSECPICVHEAGALAADLPFAHTAQSRLVCFYSGEPMNENNPPLALPNGMVYSQNSLIAMAAGNADGTVVCPRTKSVFMLSEAEKVFVM